MEDKINIAETNLGGLWVSDLLGVNPVFRLEILGVVDLGLRVNSRREVLEKAAGAVRLAVEQDVVGGVGAVGHIKSDDVTSEDKIVIDLLDNESEKVGVLAEGRLGRNLQVLLLEFTGNWVLVTEDEVNLAAK